MGGSVSSNLTTSVTHVVTKDSSLFCRKYHVSAEVGIPIVSLDFVSECELEARERNSEPGAHVNTNGATESGIADAVRQITERNRFPPFAGCRISSTGFSADMRREIERFVENADFVSTVNLLADHMADVGSKCSSELIGGGGLYCGVLTSDCTHLIAFCPEGEKFKFAKARSIPVVSLEWFVRCLVAGARQKEDEHTVAGDDPSLGGDVPKVPAVLNPRRLHSLGREQQGSEQAGGPASGPHSNRVYASAPGLDRTLSAALARSGVPSTRESVASSGILHQEGQEAYRPFSFTRAASSGSEYVDSLDLPPGLVASPRVDSEDDSDVAVVDQQAAPAPRLRPQCPPLPRGAKTAFESCCIALSQASLSLARRNEWRSKIVASGGDCVSDDNTMPVQINRNELALQDASQWTHFVVDDSDELCTEDIQVLQLANAAKKTGRPIVVQCGWLRECWRTGRRANESTFSILWPERSAEASISELTRRVSKRQPNLQSMVGQPLASSVFVNDEFDFLVSSRSNTKKRGIASSSGADYEHSSVTNPKHPRRLVGELALDNAGRKTVLGTLGTGADGGPSPLLVELSASSTRHMSSGSLHTVCAINSGDKDADAGPAVFARCIFTSLGLTASATSTFKQVVQENGGVYTDVFGGYPSATCDQHAPILPMDQALNALASHVDGTSVMDAYIVIPLRGIDELDMCETAQRRHKFMHIVTECWVDQCVHDSFRYPDYHAIQDLRLPYPGLSNGQHIVFKPLRSARVAGAEALSLSISGYEGTERDHIGMLAQALGISYSERLPRKTTHLICHRPFKGLKYERALKWGIQVVDSTWFYDLAATGQADGLGTSDSGQRVTSPRMASATTRDREALPGHSTILCSGRQALTPLTRPSQQSLLLGTPGRTPMDISLERNIQQALGNNRLRNRVGQDDQDDSVGNDSDATQMSPTRWQPGFSTTLPVAAAPLSGGSGSGSLAAVLEGIVIAISARLLYRRDELTLLAHRLGCRVLPRFDAKMATHLIHQSNRERETLRDYQLAVQSGVRVVSPWWLYECCDTMSAVPEDGFPYTYSRDRRLMLVATSQAPPKEQHTDSSTSNESSGHQQISLPHSRAYSAKSKHEYSSYAAASLVDATNPGPLVLQGMSSALTTTDTREIGSLFGIKAAGTRRKYRRTVDGVEHEDAEKLANGADHASGAMVQLARLQELQRHSVSVVPSSAESISRSGTSAEDAYLTKWRGHAGTLTPDKWWLNPEPAASARFAVEYQAPMYSQDLPPNGGHGLDSLPCTIAPAEDLDSCTVLPFEPHQLTSRGESQARQVAADIGASALASSPLTAHKTTIVYGEDAEALSERDQLIQRLIKR
ncbi:protein kinase activating protein dpb11 [Coemansia sp. BCRC 34301]|nr:protein kinase activating protein dpb11 [Coemansia sp. BCRC 34301]